MGFVKDSHRRLNLRIGDILRLDLYLGETGDRVTSIIIAHRHDGVEPSRNGCARRGQQYFWALGVKHVQCNAFYQKLHRRHHHPLIAAHPIGVCHTEKAVVGWQG